MGAGGQSSISGHNKKILVADDSLTIQKVIKLALSSEGYEIEAVSDGKDALERISLARPDVVLIDVSLPQLSAFHIKTEVDRIRREQGDLKNVRFILMSSAFERVDEAKLAQTAFDGHLTKPFDPANLRQVLQEVLRTTQTTAGDSADVLDLEPIQPDEPLQEFNLDAPADTPLDTSDGPTQPDFLPPLSDVAERTSADPDSDIRSLTESTIRMSGLDEFQWTIEEKAQKIPPAPASAQGQAPAQEMEPELPPPPRMVDIGETSFELDGLLTSHEDVGLNSDDRTLMIENGHSAPEPQAAEVLSLDGSQLEEIVQKQVRDTLEKLAREILPEVAERVIKEEISRLLNERP